MGTTTWPFGTDAIQDDPLTALRIPVVTGFNPTWRYVAAYLNVVEDGPDYLKGPPFGSLERPTDTEAAMLASFLQEHRHYWFNNQGYARKMDQRPLDIDSGWNTTIFIKYAEADWGYRRVSWTYGPTFVPGPPSYRERYPKEAGPDPLTLEKVMDRFHAWGDEPSPRWQQWKADHPEVFPA